VASPETGWFSAGARGCGARSCGSAILMMGIDGGRLASHQLTGSSCSREVLFWGGGILDQAGPSPLAVGRSGFAASVALANSSRPREVLGSPNDGPFRAPRRHGRTRVVTGRLQITWPRILPGRSCASSLVGGRTIASRSKPPGGPADLAAFAECLRDRDRVCQLRQLPAPRWVVTIPAAKTTR
jgi:hypothetical protein